MRVIVKKPGKVPQIKEVADLNAIRDIVAPRSKWEFVVFKDEDNIGMYTEELFDCPFNKRNFYFKNNILYGPAVFVGLDREGKAKDLTVYQMSVIDNYLNHNAIA